MQTAQAIQQSTDEFAYSPHQGPQWRFHEANEYEILYGGAAGGGKTESLIVDATRDIWHEGYRAIIFRKTFHELEEIIDRTHELYPLLDGEYRASQHRWYFPSGATINLGHMADRHSHMLYQGRQYQYIAFDEVGHFLPEQYLYLNSRCRSKHPGLTPKFRATTNPGGPCHVFLKDRFQIENVPPETVLIDPLTGLDRKFIPAKLSDNPSLTLNDPLYIKRLMLLPEIERKRLIDGDWSAFEGQVFAELNREIHGIDPFPLPPEWSYFRAFDWGYSAPWVCVWFGMDPDGQLFIVRVLYGGKKDDTGQTVGLKQTDQEIARQILAVERDELKVKVRPGPADPSIWSKKQQKHGITGRPTATEMQAEGIVWLRADNDRLNGKRQFHTRLALDEEGSPNIYIFNEGCDAFWETIPALQADPNNNEDVDTKQEDHCYDAVRYGFMFKPMKPKLAVKPDVGSFAYERRKMIKARAYAKKHGVSMAVAYGRVRG